MQGEKMGFCSLLHKEDKAGLQQGKVNSGGDVGRIGL